MDSLRTQVLSPRQCTQRGLSMGRLCQATVCRPCASRDLPLALYPPRCDRQLPTRFDDGGQSQLPVARLRLCALDSHHDLDAHEFLRRFLLHVLPAGFVCIRYFACLPLATAIAEAMPRVLAGKISPAA